MISQKRNDLAVALDETLISVLIPAYNAAATIRETLESACAQTHSNLEIIVVDDGSSDATAELVADAAVNDPRIQLIRQSNAGVAAARNAAWNAAHGDWIAPLDADDLWHPSKLARQLSSAAANPDCQVVYCWSVDIDVQSQVTERRLQVCRFEGDVYAALVLDNFLGNSSTPLIRRRALDEAGGWDPSLSRANATGCEDWQLYLQLARTGRFALEPAFLVGYRQGDEAMSRNIPRMLRSHRMVMAQERAARPDIPQRLFRWSDARYRRYLAGLLIEKHRPFSALTQLMQALFRDPREMLKRSAWSPLLHARGGRKQRNDQALQPFAKLDPDPSWVFPPDRLMTQRLDAISRTFTARVPCKNNATTDTVELAERR